MPIAYITICYISIIYINIATRILISSFALRAFFHTTLTYSIRLRILNIIQHIMLACSIAFGKYITFCAHSLTRFTNSG